MECYLNYPSVVERYFRRMYSVDVMGKANEDVCLMFHSNRVCVITLAPSHPIVAEKKSVKQVDYQVTKKINRCDNKVSGKTKRGGQFLTYESPLCRITCNDDSVFVVRGCANARLLEVNENLHNRPQLLVDANETEGYLAITIPTRKNNFVNGREKLLNRTDYTKLRFPDVEFSDSEIQRTECVEVQKDDEENSSDEDKERNEDD